MPEKASIWGNFFNSNERLARLIEEDVEQETIKEPLPTSEANEANNQEAEHEEEIVVHIYEEPEDRPRKSTRPTQRRRPRAQKSRMSTKGKGKQKTSKAAHPEDDVPRVYSDEKQKRIEQNLTTFHSKRHPLHGQTVRLSSTLPMMKHDVRQLVGIDDLSGQEFVVDDWFDHKFGQSIWRDRPRPYRHYTHKENASPYKDQFDEYTTPSLVFMIRVAEMGSKKGDTVEWLNNDVICGTIDGQPVIVLARELGGNISQPESS